MIDFRIFDVNTLFIIGNGFDAAHGIKSSYWDFRDWLFFNNYSDEIIMFEKVFPLSDGNTNLLWKDFEMAIGQYNEEEIHDVFFKGVDNGQFDKDVQDRVAEYIKPFIVRIPKYMKEWARYMKDMNYNRVFEGLKPEFKYLTFNYTLVLETNYQIPSDNICHIHGCINDERIIVGHNNKKEVGEYKGYSNREYSKRNIIELMNTNVKPVNDLIIEKQQFFSSLSDITRIIVFGHSLAEIDMPYFLQVASVVKKNCVWHFCWHTLDDRASVERFVHLPEFFGFTYTMHEI